MMQRTGDSDRGKDVRQYVVPQVRVNGNIAVNPERTADAIGEYLQRRGLDDAAISGTLILFGTDDSVRNPLIRGYYDQTSVDGSTGEVHVLSGLRKNKKLIHELEHRIDHYHGTIDEGAEDNFSGPARTTGILATLVSTPVNIWEGMQRAKYKYYPDLAPANLDLIHNGGKLLFFGGLALQLAAGIRYRSIPTEKRAFKAARTKRDQLIQR